MAFVGEALLSASFESIISQLLSPTIKEFITRRGIDKDLKRLGRMLPKIQAVLDDAEQKETSEKFVKEWLKDLTDVAYDIQDIMDELAYEVERSKIEGETETALHQVCNFFSPGYTNSFLSEQVDGVMKRLVEIEEDMKSLSLSEIVGRRWLGKTERLPTTSVIDELKFVGREDDTNEIIELLLKPGSNNISVISIVGMGGVGKTTLAQYVFDDERVKEQFEIKAWVCVSDEFDVRRLTQAILESVTMTTSDFKELNTLQVILKDKLKGKRFLLILDDVWNEKQKEWNLLRAPLLVGASGSKILITTRNKQVALITRADSAYHLGVLSDEHCYSLFMQCAFAEGNSSDYPHLEAIGKEIVKKCKGLPLAVKALGGLLYSEVNEDEWKYVLQSEMWDLQLGSNDILPALRLSYHHLPSHLKQCFAYCSIFPKDFEFNKEMLIWWWMAEGYVQSKGTKCLENVGSEYFDDLFSRCFFQHTKEGNIVMHDLVHDLAQSVSGELYGRMGDDLSSNISQRTRHLSYLFIKSNSEKIANLEALYKAKSLRTVLSLQDIRINWQPPHDFLQKLRFLRLLDLSCTAIDEIPDSVGSLRLLRCLDLSVTDIKMLPESIGRLFNLQILKVKYCVKFKELPMSIGNLKQLRQLILSHTGIETLPESIGNLSNLHKLLLESCCEFKELPNAIGNLKHLQCIDVSETPIQMLPESIDSLSNLQELILVHCKRLRKLPKNFRNLISLRRLDNDGCHELVSIPLEIGKLTTLQKLPLFVVSGESGAKLRELKELKNLRGKLHISGLENVINGNEVKDAALEDKQHLQYLTLEWGNANGNL